jgi:hypothetical protein
MRNRWIRAVGVMATLALPWTARGADHADGTPGTLFSPDASSDITDIFAWMSPDSMKIKLVMDVAPGAMSTTKFSDAVKYVFHTNSKASFTATPANAVDVICTFDTASTQHISCWFVKLGATPQVLDYATGDASATTGLNSVLGKFKVFAGLRDDPFYFNLAGFKKAVETAAAAAGGLTDHGHGCPNLPGATAAALVNLLGKDCTGGAAPQDFFAPTGTNTGCDNPTTHPGGPLNHALTGNVLAIAILADKTLVNQGGNIVGVWGATTH